MPSSSSSKHQPQGSPADKGGENHAEGSASKPGGSSDHISTKDIESHPLLTTESKGAEANEGGENHVEANALSPGSTSYHSAYNDINGISTPLLTLRNPSGLYLAALTGNWDGQAKGISCLPLTAWNETALHIAASAEQTDFVEKLVNITTPKDLGVKTGYGYTALCFAAKSGNVRMGKVLVKGDPGLPNLRGNNGYASIPLYLAVKHKRRDMADYLLPMTDLTNLDISDKLHLLHATISSDYYDIGLKILHENQDLAVQRNNVGQTTLHALAKKAQKIGSRSQLTIWEKYCPNIIGFRKKAWMKSLANQMVESLWTTVTKKIEKNQILDFINTPTNFLYDAAKVGNAEFLVLLIRKCPDLIFKLDYNFINVFYEAIENRQERVFKLIYEIGFKNMFGDLGGVRNTNLMRLAAQIAAPKHLKRVSNPALQMTRELEWYKEVKKIVRVSHLEEDAWREIFKKEHKQLREEGEEWLKRVSSSCMLAATLIAGAIFATTFNLRNDDIKNINPFFVFSVILALFFSTTSFISFLSILTSRFAEDDFLTLPWNLLFGFAYLFFSIFFMFMGFYAILVKFERKSYEWIVSFLNMSLYVFSVWFGAFKTSLWSDIIRATLRRKFPLERRRWGRRLQVSIKDVTVIPSDHGISQ